MLDINLTSFGTLKAGMVERTEGYAKVIMVSFDVRPGEVVVIVSNSGINPVPIELAIEAKELGASVDRRHFSRELRLGRRRATPPARSWRMWPTSPSTAGCRSGTPSCRSMD